MKNPFGMFSMYKELPKTMFVFFMATMVNSLGHYVRPFLTFFLSEKAGLPETTIGTILAVTAAAYLPGSLIAGKLADTFGRKKIYLAAFALEALCLVPCAFLGTSLIIPALIILSGFFGGMAMPCHTAMIMDLAPQKDRKAAFSLIYLGHNIGFSVGALLAGFLYRRYMKLLFLGDAATTLIAVFLVFFLVPETMPSKETIEAGFEDRTGEKAEKGHIFKVLLSRPFLFVFMLIMPIYSFVYSQVDFSLPLFAARTFGDSGSMVYGTVMTVNTLVVVFLTVPAISLTRKLKPLVNIILAGCLYALGFGLLYVGTSLFLVCLSTVVWTIGEIFQATNMEVYAAGHTPISHRARLNSIIPPFMDSGEFFGPILTGAFIAGRSVRMVWPLVFVLSLSAAGALFTLFLAENRRLKQGNL